MKIILRENIEKLGTMGEVLEVKNGYARNYLIPTEKAYPATKSFMNVITSEVEAKRKIMEQDREKAKLKAKEMENVSVNIEVAVGEEDKMFGSVTSQHIAAKLSEQGFDIDRKKLALDHPIKALGIFHVPLKLHYDVSVDIKVRVVKEHEESHAEEAVAEEAVAEEAVAEEAVAEEAVAEEAVAEEPAAEEPAAEEPAAEEPAAEEPAAEEPAAEDDSKKAE